MGKWFGSKEPMEVEEQRINYYIVEYINPKLEMTDEDRVKLDKILEDKIAKHEAQIETYSNESEIQYSNQSETEHPWNW
jgi:thiamine biosynthesis lipoprotein ApbE